MKQISVQKLARVLRALVLVTFVCNLAALLLVPGMVGMYAEGGGWETLATLTPYEHPWELPLRVVVLFFVVCWQYLSRVWRETYTAVLTLFLWACGGCTAVILWQAKRVLESILKEDTFTLGNAANMRRAAVCCFVISGAALLRTVWGFAYFGNVSPLFTYNTLFVPVFLMAGLLCTVMSALFRQAAELKADNDLTI